MNTLSACWYAVFAPARLLRNWREQRPSNQDDLYSSVTGEVGRFHYMGVHLLLISFLHHSTWLLGFFLNGKPCITIRLGNTKS
jgi:hypothetical protein